MALRRRGRHCVQVIWCEVVVVFLSIKRYQARLGMDGFTHRTESINPIEMDGRKWLKKSPQVCAHSMDSYISVRTHYETGHPCDICDPMSEST